jgi:hypothetical protein
MSNCRFRNTIPDLQDCFEALSRGVLYELKREDETEELAAALALLRTCYEIVEEFPKEDYEE